MHVYCNKRDHLGPVWSFLRLSKEYGLFEVVKGVIENCDAINMSWWKQQVLKVIWQRQRQKMLISCTLNKTLSLVSVNNQPGILAWWHYIQKNTNELYKCRAVIRLYLDCHKLKTCRLRYKCENVTSDKCEFCPLACRETAQHILFECTGNKDQRDLLWQECVQLCPLNLHYEIMSMSISKRTSFVLSCFNNTLVSEWMPLYEGILNYVYKVYNERVHAKLLL